MKTVRMLVVFSCVLLLVLSSLPLGASKNTARASVAQTTVDEVEPNDDPLSAQEIPFPGPGESVVFRGSVMAGDRGGFSEELETWVQAGAIHDWIVADPDSLAKQALGDGPIPLHISIGWDSGADVDAWIGTTVDDSTFAFDGYQHFNGFRTASLRNPETWPAPADGVESLGLYLQPQGITVEGDPLLNDGFGRKLMIGIQHFDGPAANYTVTIRNGASPAKQGGGFANERHQIDDSGPRTDWFGGPSGALILNRYRPSRYPATLTAVSHPFINFADIPDPTGRPIRVVVLAGDDDAPDAEPPALTKQSAVLFDQMIPIPGTISPEPNTFFPGASVDIPVGPITITSGVVYVGLQFPTAPIEETGVTLALSTTPVQYLRSYFSDDNGATWGRPVFEESLTAENVFTNAAVRAIFTYGAAKAAPSGTRLGNGRAVKRTFSNKTITNKPLAR